MIICKYCNQEMEDKGFKADGHRYHFKCLKTFRKEIDRQKYQGKIKPGQENRVQTPGQHKYIKEQQ